MTSHAFFKAHKIKIQGGKPIINGKPSTIAKKTSDRQGHYQPKALWVGLLCGLIAFIIIAATATTIISTRKNTLTDEMNNLKKLSFMLSEYTHSIIYSADLLLLSLEEQISRAGIRTPEEYQKYVHNKDIHLQLMGMLSSATHVDTLGIEDHNGIILNSTRNWPMPPVDVSNRKYFTSLRDSPKSTRAISKPVTSKITGQEIIILARRINAPDGSFLGIVVAVISTQRFDKIFSKILNDNDIQASLFRNDGVLINQEPSKKSNLEKDNAIWKYVQKGLSKSDNFNLHTHDISSIRPSQLLALNTVRGYALSISVAKNEEKILAKLQTFIYLIGAISTATAILVILMGIIFIRSLNMNTEYFRRIFEDSSIGMAINDVNGRFLRVNGILCKILGYSPQEFLALSATDILFDPVSVIPLLAQGQTESEQDVSEGLEVLLVHKNGQNIWVLLNRSLARSESGRPKYFVSQIQDISERKHLEEQLRQSQSMEAISKLTGGIAHDFNNLLGVMLGNTEIVEDKINDNKKARPQIEAIKKAIDRAASLTSRLIAFSRQQPLASETTNISELIINLEDMLHCTLGETITLKIETSEGLKPAIIDPHQLDNALLNLTLNARDAMAKGGTLTIRAVNITLDNTYVRQHTEVTPGDYVKLSLSDTGSGMSPAVREKAFEPFFTTKEFGNSSGLGLSMVYGFVKQSGGHIDIMSKTGRGTTVSLYLPIAKPENENQNIPLGSISHHPFPLSHHQQTILVVEDDPGIRETTVKTLRTADYHVFQAQDGPSALRELDILKAEKLSVDLVLSDVVMPNNMSGVELAEKISSQYKGIKILFISGYSDTIINPDILEKLEIELLAKPYRREQLIEAVEIAISKRP